MSKLMTKKKMDKTKEHDIEGRKIDIQLSVEALKREQELWDKEELVYQKEIAYGYKIKDGIFEHWLDPEYVEAKKFLLNAIYEDKKDKRIGQRNFREDKIAQMQEELEQLEGD